MKEPRPHGAKKLTDYQSVRTKSKTCYRIRSGDYRVIYTIEDEVVTITVIKVAHRNKVYKNA